MASSAFVFPGQGAQYVGMGVALCEKSPKAKVLFESASSVLGYDLLDICKSGPVERINATDVSQPAIYVASIAALEDFRDSNPDIISSCNICAGLSLGEYTALTFAGVISFADGIRLVKERGEAMQAAAESVSSGMISVIGAEKDKVGELCQQASSAGLIQMANFLCPGNIVVSGEMKACDALEKIASEAGVRTVRLAVAGAFHTPIMAPALQRLSVALAGTNVQKPQINVLSNVNASLHETPESIKSLLARQVVEPVLWEDCMRNILGSGVEKVYEIGPGRVLAGLAKRINRKLEVVNISA